MLKQDEEACGKQPAHVQDSLVLQAAGTTPVHAGLCNGCAHVCLKQEKLKDFFSKLHRRAFQIPLHNFKQNNSLSFSK